MNDICKRIVDHISRIQGQLNTMKKYIDEEKECEEVVQLASSTTKSFDSLKAKIVEGYIIQDFLGNKKISEKEQKKLDKLMKLIKK